MQCTAVHCKKTKQLREIGLIPFLLYINDLPNCLQFSQTRMYADDNSLTFASTDVNYLNGLNYDRSKVYTWLSANKLISNLAKTAFLSLEEYCLIIRLVF